MNRDAQIKTEIEKLREHIKPFENQINSLLQEQRENELNTMRELFQKHREDIFTYEIGGSSVRHVRIINMEERSLVCEELVVNRDSGNFDEEKIVFHWTYHPSPAFFRMLGVVMVNKDEVKAKKIQQTMDLLKEIYYTY